MGTDNDGESSPLKALRRAVSFFEGTPQKQTLSLPVAKAGTEAPLPTLFHIASVASPQNRWQPFDIADELEKGSATLARRMSLLRRVRDPVIKKKHGDLHRFTIVYQATTEEYQLMSEDLELLLVARKTTHERAIEFDAPTSTADEESTSNAASSSSPYAGRRPPFFSMTYSQDADEWTLVQPQCEICVHRPHHLTCDFIGRSQQVACIRHCSKQVRKAKVHQLDVHIPPLTPDLQMTLWCPRWTGKDLGSRTPCSPTSPTVSATPKSSRSSLPTALPQDGEDSIHLVSRIPVWDDDLEMLILRFKDRSKLQSCPRNFMLRNPSDGEDEPPIFQHAKIAANTWCLDFRHPLNLVQVSPCG